MKDEISREDSDNVGSGTLLEVARSATWRSQVGVVKKSIRDWHS